MKNLSTVINVVLVPAVAVLFYMVLSGKNTPEPVKREINLPQASADGLSVAYVNMDTLQVYYNYYKELMEQFQAEAKSAEKRLLQTD